MVIGIISPTFEGGDITVGNEQFTGIPKTTYSPGSGERVTFGNSEGAHGIFLPAYTLQSGFDATLTHELGHVIARKLTSSDWIKWAQLRGAPNTDFSSGSWQTNTKEDFAETYKLAFGNHQGGSADLWDNHTSWGKRACQGSDTRGYQVMGSCFVDTLPSSDTVTFIREILKRFQP